MKRLNFEWFRAPFSDIIVFFVTDKYCLDVAATNHILCLNALITTFDSAMPFSTTVDPRVNIYIIFSFLATQFMQLIFGTTNSLEKYEYFKLIGVKSSLN